MTRGKLYPPRVASRRASTATLVAAVLPNWRGELSAVRLARHLRRPIGEVLDALKAAQRAGRPGAELLTPGAGSAA